MVSTSWHRFGRIGLACGLVLLGALCRCALAGARIESVVPGFGGLYKVGHWCPVHVTVKADEQGFGGYLTVRCPDVDDIVVRFGGPISKGGGVPVSLGANESRTWTIYVRPGNLGARIEGVLLNADGREVQSRSPDPAVITPVAEETFVLLGLGMEGILSSRALEEIAGRSNMARSGAVDLQFVQVSLDSPEVPAAWLGYDMVDAVLLALDDNVLLTRMSPAKQQAIANWVRLGGHLVVSLASGLPALRDTPLDRLLPVEVEGVVKLSDASDFESFAKTPKALPLPKGGLDVPAFRIRRGKALVSHRGQPLLVRAPFGFGTVDVVALPFGSNAFSQWEGRHDFVSALLPTHLWRQTGGSATMRFVAETDLASIVKQWVERYQGVVPVSFQWIAFGIFAYILLIGPVDYFLVRRVFGRPELTWLTFSIGAIGLCVLVWVAIQLYQGKEIYERRVELIDVHQPTRFVRGFGVGSVFTPFAQTLTVTVRPDVPFVEDLPELRPRCVLHWAAVPEDALGGTSRAGSLPLSAREYGYGTDYCRLEGVPMYTRSGKTFAWVWGGRCRSVLRGNLSAAAGYHLRGSLQNRSGYDFNWLVVAYSNRTYILHDVQDRAVVRVEDADTLSLSAFVTRFDRLGKHGDLARALLQATFYQAVGDTLMTTNYTLSRLDMSQFGTDPEYAVAIGWAEGQEGVTWHAATAEAPQSAESVVMLRVVLPVQAERMGVETLLRDQQ